MSHCTFWKHDPDVRPCDNPAITGGTLCAGHKILRDAAIAPTEGGSCRNRIWDNGDTDSCGNLTKPGNHYCERCLPDLLRKAELDIHAKTASLRQAEQWRDLLVIEIDR